MKKEKRVLLCGWYGAGNVGDEMLLGIVSSWCRERDGRVTALSIDPAYTREYHGIEAIDLYDMAAVAREMARTDLFVLGGGGLFQTHQPLTVPALYDFDISDVAVYARPVLLAKQFGVPVLPLAQGVGPIDGSEAGTIVRTVFQCAERASVRDAVSHELLTALGVETKVLVAPDPVWAMPVRAPAAQSGDGPRRLCVTPRTWAFVDGWEDAFIEALRATVDTSSIELVWLPFQTRSVPGRVLSELEFTKALMRRMDETGSCCQMMVVPDNEAQLLDTISRCDGLVAMRLHAQILGLKLGVPTFCLRYDSKLLLAGEQAGMPEGSGIDIAAAPAEWVEALGNWWAGGRPSACLAPDAVSTLGEQALAHRDCLHDAIDRAQCGQRGWDADFDWMGTWQQKAHDAALQRRDHALLRLSELLSTAHSVGSDAIKASAEMVQAFAVRDSEIQRLSERLVEVETERSALAADLQTLWAERDAEAIVHREELAGRDALLSQRDADLAASNQLLARRVDEIKDLQAALAESRAACSERSERLQQANVRVAELEADLDSARSRMQQLAIDVASREAMVAEKDLRIDQLKGVLLVEQERAQTIQREVNALRASTSWRLTRPLRFVRYLFRDPRFAISHAKNKLFSSWPPKGITNGNVDHLNERARPHGSLPAVAEKHDLNWIEFERQVLSHRAQYKGVFIQEVVIDWNVPLYQRPQHIASAMARLGYLVIYKTVNWTGDDVDGFREVSKNVWLTNRHEVDQINRAVRSVYSTAYADDPDNLRRRPCDGVMMYEYIDHIDPQISGDSDNIQRLLSLRNWAFSGGADIVVASARELEREACLAVGRDRVLLVQNGVDTKHYRNISRQPSSLPRELVEFRSRYAEIVGYFGALAPWLWYEEIAKLVAARPDIGFVFIGPDYYGGAGRLPTTDNVLYLGAVDYKVLPSHAMLFDVCFIPFSPGEIARTTSPLKLFEYFALEKPVVVTSEMLECIAYPEVFSGSCAAELSRAIDQAISVKLDPAMIERLAQLAEENDWDRRALALEVAFSKLPSG